MWHKSPRVLFWGLFYPVLSLLGCYAQLLLDHLKGIYYYFCVRVKSWHLFCPQRFFLLWNCYFVILALRFCHCPIEIYTFYEIEKFKLAGYPEKLPLSAKFIVSAFHSWAVVGFAKQIGLAQSWKYSIVVWLDRIFDLLLSNPAHVFGKFCIGNGSI